VDPLTNSTSSLSSDSFTLKFSINEETNLIELIFDYGQQNLENSVIQFNLDINATNLTSLKHFPLKAENRVPVFSNKNAVYLYGYD
jgi:hypothetical protein